MDSFFWRVFPFVFWLLFAGAIGTAVYTAVLAYRAGCIESMLLNGVCASDPRVDRWFSR